MTTPSPRAILDYGLSTGNTGLVQLLGLCPLLAVSNNAVTALALGVATLVALILTNTAVSAIRRFTNRDLRIPVFVMVIATVVTAIELTLRAALPELHAATGLFLPLIVSNCALMGRAEAFASRQAPHLAALDGFATGLGFLGVLVLIGVLREVIGTGRLFADAGTLLHWPSLTMTVLPGYRGFLIATLPVGAFLILAALIAGRQAWRRHRTAPGA
jgi:Na+-translocating ferredoxin:NAD+ oxidoreductase subunit E